ncbi:hypothetical protein EON67_03780 [archaeon]|nr:MAG: hypothetical protein EON67_03780 [archaeon]
MNKARALASSGARARGSESAAAPSSPAPVSSGEGATITGFNGVLPDGSFAPGMVCAPADATPHPASALLTLVGTEHHNMNDFALILRRPMAMAKMIGKRAHPRRALDLLIDASLQYMGAFGSRAPRANRKSGTVPPASGTAGTAFVARMLQRYGEHEAGGRDGKRSTRPALPHFSDAAWKA